MFSKYLQYYLRASNGRGHGIHSPFVYDFVRQVLNGPASGATERVEDLRRKLLADRRTLEVEDFGAGSRLGKTRRRRIADIARHSSKSQRQGLFLNRLVSHYQRRNMLELGSCLGLSAACMASGNPAARITSIEGSASLAALAKEHVQELGLPGVEIRCGLFDSLLPEIIQERHAQAAPGFDLVFIDGNHRLVPTLHYFDLLRPAMAPNGIMVFDDIHWSAEMESAWAHIVQDESVMLTVDLFFFGLIFFGDQFREKQHFIIRV